MAKIKTIQLDIKSSQNQMIPATFILLFRVQYTLKQNDTKCFKEISVLKVKQVAGPAIYSDYSSSFTIKSNKKPRQNSEDKKIIFY